MRLAPTSAKEVVLRLAVQIFGTLTTASAAGPTEMRFTNLTRANEIGANSYLLKIGGKNVLLDCGMHPRFEGVAATPDLSILPEDLEAAIVTHSHLDHAGALPVLRRLHPAARVFLTTPTARLNDVLLHNSVNVMHRRHEANANTPRALYTHRDADQAARVWQEVPLGQPWSIEGERLAEHGEEPVSFELAHAGHILGSAGVLLHERTTGRRLFYTGDVNFEDQTIARAARFPESGVDTLVIECTRGDYERPPEFRRVDEELRFGTALAAALERGAVLIPVFALGKSQEVLAMLLRFVELGLLAPRTPLFIGGLSTRITELHDSFAGTGEFHVKHGDLLRRLQPGKLMGAEAMAHVPRAGCIYALSSGMMTEGTLSHTFARKMVGNERHSIFFVGYADPISAAGRLKTTPPGGMVEFGPDLPPQELRCKIEKFDFSAHAQRETIRAYIHRLAPSRVLLVHGDRPALDWFAAAVASDLPRAEVIIPEPRRTYDV